MHKNIIHFIYTQIDNDILTSESVEIRNELERRREREEKEERGREEKREGRERAASSHQPHVRHHIKIEVIENEHERENVLSERREAGV